MPNALTRHVGLNAGGWVLGTLLKHYFDQVFSGNGKSGEASVAGVKNGNGSGDLKRDDLMYAEVFHIVKSFMNASAHHTVDELQQFSNTRTPSAPWMLVKRLLVPMTCCDDAATYVIDVLGGEEKTRELVGGTKWWQVRGLKGVDAQWIVAKKDFQKQKRRRKEREQSEKEPVEFPEASEEELVDNPEVGDLKCILFFHGGGYYFGSTDQERYFIQRLARKSGCRAFAVNYRLAPQYPFPCAIQDALASYLYLIKPPPEALHSAINPSDIVIAGDSAGGGLTLALLQVLRDVNLPLPAGGIPISPWCDLTHSFPSIHINTDSDIIPEYGLSMYRPSALWPPPSEDLTERVRAGLRTRIKEAAQYYRGALDRDGAQKDEEKHPGFWRRHFSLKYNAKSKRPSGMSRSQSVDGLGNGDVRKETVEKSATNAAIRNGHVESNLEIGSTAPMPTADRTDAQTLIVETESGEKLVVKDQVHLYTVNTLLTHPLVSPAYSYLGGLPPLLVIASDSEVLRDEIIYTAHKMAHPERYPVTDEARRLYPKLEGIESRHGPTQVHLQVYDQTAHILPVLFGFCTPAKFCFRAMNSFNRHVWKVPYSAPSKRQSTDDKPGPRKLVKRSVSTSSASARNLFGSTSRRASLGPSPSGTTNNRFSHKASEDDNFARRSLSRRSDKSSRSSLSSEDKLHTITPNVSLEMRFAGDPSIYKQQPSAYVDNMIRERVSIRGQVRPLEPEEDLPACNMPPEKLGVAGELALRRYLEGKAKWGEKYGRTQSRINKKRARNLTLAKKETVRNVTQLQMHFFQDANGSKESGAKGVKEGLRSAASWAWAWALDGLENPPPSSIVARRDTEEARRLSRIADEPVDDQEHPLSGNNLWSYLFSRLGSEKEEAERDERKQVGAEDLAYGSSELGELTKSSRARRSNSFFAPRKKANIPRRYASASAPRPRREDSLHALEEEDQPVPLSRVHSSAT